MIEGSKFNSKMRQIRKIALESATYREIANKMNINENTLHSYLRKRPVFKEIIYKMILRNQNQND